MDHLGSAPNTTRLWIFGYGSLCWRPGFEYDDVITGYITGYSRKFWQGNTTHRGTACKPGRVATLVEDKSSTVWGCAFEISGEAALPYLNNRECKLGGYMTRFASFYPRKGSTSLSSSVDSDTDPRPFTVMLYIATPKNDLWLGDAPLYEIAHQITECSGESGHNVEYLLRLAEFMREHVPEAIDEHLFTLEHLVRTRIKEQNMCMKMLMGGGEGLRIFEQVRRNGAFEPDVHNDHGERMDTFQFTARVPKKNLRCLKI